MMRVEGVVHGRVQGVGYRAFVRSQATLYHLRGWVRNDAKGTVTFVAEGERGALEAFLDDLHQGPMLARVTRIDEAWGPARELHGGFEVRYTQ